MANVIAPVLRHAGADPDHIALRCAQRSWTYAQLRDAALAYAQALRTQGIGPGDRVLLIAPTVPEFVIAYFGIPRWARSWSRLTPCRRGRSWSTSSVTPAVRWWSHGTNSDRPPPKPLPRKEFRIGA